MSMADGLEGVPIAREDAKYLATTLTPSKVICLGLNYADHIAEMGRKDAGFPTLFAKFPDTLTGPFDDITLPTVSSSVDWEVELGVVVGKAARHVSVEDARDHIAGFVVANDVSMRDFQRRTTQFLQGKMFEASTPVGPMMVTPDEVDYAADLEIICEVDGEVMQSSRTSRLITSIETTISYVSEIITLRPGDLILTGTPSGVGAGRNPQMFIQKGQTVRSRIEGLGEIANRFV